MTEYFYEIRETKESDAPGARNGDFVGVVYHYDETGNREIIVHKTEVEVTEGDAEDAVVDWMEANKIDATFI